MEEQIKNLIQASIVVKLKMLTSVDLWKNILLAKNTIVMAFEKNKKVLFCGNGGSAADAQHLSAEFSGRFYKNRPALYSDALHCNSSYLTAVANDYCFDQVYARIAKGIIVQGDVLVAISTSGNSKNIINAVKAARENGAVTIGFTGESGGELSHFCHHLINVPSSDTPRIQEAHILIGHIICQLTEAQLFPEKATAKLEKV